MFTGSGMPMRFADRNGSPINIYQATTQMTDESGQSYPGTIDALLANALGPKGYYGVFTANMHTDDAVSTDGEAIINAALANGVPVVSAKQMLTWLDGRNQSSFGSISWAGGKLQFNISPGAGATGLQGDGAQTVRERRTRIGQTRHHDSAADVPDDQGCRLRVLRRSGGKLHCDLLESLRRRPPA